MTALEAFHLNLLPSTGMHKSLAVVRDGHESYEVFREALSAEISDFDADDTGDTSEAERAAYDAWCRDARFPEPDEFSLYDSETGEPVDPDGADVTEFACRCAVIDSLIASGVHRHEGNVLLAGRRVYAA